MTRMPDRHCEEVRQFIGAAARSRSFVPPPAQLAEHIAGCTTCQGALALLLRELLGGPSQPPRIGCATCQQRIAAYAELDSEGGTALRTYPEISWHIATCAECAEIYALTAALLEAERAGALSAFPLRAEVTSFVLATIRLTRSFLARTLSPPAPALGALRGQASDRTVLYETESADYVVSLGVQRQPDQQWSLHVTVDPPADGWVTLSLGERGSRVRLSNGGAIVPNMPAAALDAPDGPDLIGQIDLDIRAG